MASINTAAAVSSQADATPQTADAFEIGWMFVQQFYTFLNKDPSRLHCFYAKKSKLIHGFEGETVETYQGQQEIHAKILDLGFDDCHVLVSNVDSMASLNGGIIVQVLGEMCNKGGASQKFAQTFFLAEQPNGYYVLNDIFRYLKDDVGAEYELLEGASATLAAEEPMVATIGTGASHSDAALPAPVPVSTAMPDVKPANIEPALEPLKTEQKATKKASAVNVQDVSPLKQQPTQASNGTSAIEPLSRDVEKKMNFGEAKQIPSRQKPVATPSTPAAVVPTGVAKDAARAVPAAPAVTSWANLAAVNRDRWGNQASDVRGTSVPVPSPKSNIAGGDAPAVPRHDRPRYPSRDEAAVVYVKGISERIDADTLKSHLAETIGAVKSMDLVTAKGCAFVEFSTPELARSAIARGSYDLQGTTFTVEERRRFSAGGGRGRGGHRGGFDRPFFDRSSGGFAGRGRGRGRGARPADK